MRERTSYVLGLVGAGIGASLTPPMQEREGRESGLALSYRVIDAEVQGFGPAHLPQLLQWARRLGFDGLNITHPFKQHVVPLLDELSEDADDLGAVNTVVFRDGRALGRNTDWSGYGRAFRRTLPNAVEDRVVLVGAGGAGVAVGYALLEQGAAHVAVVDLDQTRADDCVTRLAKKYGDDRVSATTDVVGALAEAEGLVNATPVGMFGHEGLPVAEELVHPGLWVSDVVYFPLETQLIALARATWLPGGPGWWHGRLPGGRCVRALHRPCPRRGAHVPSLRGADALMHKGIATVSLSGVLEDKLDAIAAAGFDGVEIFDNDLISSPVRPTEVAGRCAELGLSIDLFQPVRDVEGVPPDQFDRVQHRLRRKFAVMAELGTSTVLACSNVGADSLADTDLRAEQLHRIGGLAEQHGVTVAYEALAWGRHVNRVGQAWDAVVTADHPAITLAVDTFHMLARGDGGAALAGIPGDRIGFLQVADAPLLDMNVLEWSRHFRCFPGQGTLDVAGVVAAVLEAGYRGPLSLEVFSDVVREADPRATARDAMRSLVFLEDQLAQRVTGPAREVVAVAPPPASRTEAAFVEVANPADDAALPTLLDELGFRVAGRHRSKPVTWWRNGGAHIVLNEQDVADRPAATALGVVAPAVADVAERARALLWPEVDRTRGAGEALLPGVSSPSGLHVFVSSTAGEPDDWQADFIPAPTAHDREGWCGLDHVGVAVAPEQLNEEMSFFRTLFDLATGPVEEFMEPHGRLRSRALRPAAGDLRVVLNVADLGPGVRPPHGITQLAFSCRDIIDQVRALRKRGVRLMQVPDNYYDDLDARFALEPAFLAELREEGLLYDRVGDGELLHAYTETLVTGFYVELLERRGGYDGYGAANTHVRLAAQRRP